MAQAANLKLNLGRKGEALAKRYLKKQGYRRLADNYKTRQGEIDLVMQQDDTIVFTEVKTRRHENFTEAETVVNYGKQQRISATAQHFIHQHQLHDHPCRFDVVVIVLEEGKKPIIRHHQNAFVSRK